MKTELLAPAKDVYCAISAINYGADAVYIGANAFGARHNATNPIPAIEKAINYAHKYNVKIYATVNTILDDNEILQAQKLIYNLYNIGTDAIIIQDLGLLELDLPPIALHASTQCDNRSLEKVKFLEKTGFERVILARELSLEQIQNICKNTTVEIETFIHGALCVSYSGQCYLSQSIGGRSANRGECAQPCRKKYSLVDSNGNYIAKSQHLLSLKDFNASSEIRDLINAGVHSFKIEGRLKDENYIKNVVGYYRKLIDLYSEKTSSGKINFDFEPDINKVFNRGFTNYFLKGRNKIFNFNTPKFMGEKAGKVIKVSDKYFIYDGNKLSAQDGLCFIANNKISGFLINKIEGNKIYPHKMPELKSGTTLYRNIDVKFNKNVENSNTSRKIGIDFILQNNLLIAEDEDNNNVQIDIGTFEDAQNIKKAQTNIIEQLKKAGETIFYVKNIFIKSEKIPFIPISKINEFRRNILDKLQEKRLENYKKPEATLIKTVNYFTENLDYKANIHNSYAKKFYEKRGVKETALSYEKAPLQNAEVMRTKHCLKYAFDMCHRQDKLYLEDEYGQKYNLEFDCKNCEMIIKKHF